MLIWYIVLLFKNGYNILRHFLYTSLVSLNLFLCWCSYPYFRMRKWKHWIKIKTWNEWNTLKMRNKMKVRENEQWHNDISVLLLKVEEIYNVRVICRRFTSILTGKTLEESNQPLRKYQAFIYILFCRFSVLSCIGYSRLHYIQYITTQFNEEN